MTSSEITHLSLFEIGTDSHGLAAYTFRVDMDVAPGTHAERIGDYVRSPELRAEARARHPRPADHLWPSSLDIPETRTEGACIYAFHLNAEVEQKQRLLFVERRPRFINLPINSSTGEDFLTEAEDYGDDGRWAAFVCDLGAVHGSKLAARVRENLQDGAGHHHPPRLKIPFCFSVFDPEWGVAPWVFPDETLASPIHRNEWTHGGIHPRPSSFLDIAL
jgi:hypothetical protein